jgi:hypothetical protein
MSSRLSIVSFVIIVCAVVALSFAQEQAARSNAKAEGQVAQLERDWLAADAKGDVALLRQIISDDFIGCSFEGGLLAKRDIIPEGPTSPGGFAGATVGETNVRVFGDTAVLMGVINTAGGPQPKPIHLTLVCKKTPQGWHIIATQLTRIK